MQAILRQVRISPKKARVIASMVNGKDVKEALGLLSITPKKGAKILQKVILSAASNAKNNFNQSIETLKITSINIDKGLSYKRSIPRSRGRANPRMKPTSHIKVEVAVKVPLKAKENKKTIKKD